MGTKCEGLYCLFPVFGVFKLKNNEEIPSIWRHFGARLGDQKAKDYIVYFYILSHKINFLENPKMKRDHKQRAYWLTKWGVPGAAKRQASPRVQRFFLSPPRSPNYRLPALRFRGVLTPHPSHEVSSGRAPTSLELYCITLHLHYITLHCITYTLD